MPRKYIRRWMPDPHKIANHKGLRWLGPLIDDPNLFHLTRHSVSTAMFVGIFMAFIPIPFQMLVAGLMALWLRCNLPISVVLVWITNPVTIPPLFYASYKLGIWMLGIEPTQIEFHADWEILWEWLKQVDGAQLQEWLHNIGLPFLLGTFTYGLVLGGIGYFAVRWLWRWHVVNSWEKRKKSRANSNEK